MTPPATATREPLNLKCEYFTNPLGFDAMQPRMSWLVNASPGSRGCVQSAYQIRVATSEEGLAADPVDVWDSGQVSGTDSIQVVYEGPKLRSRQRYYWQVRTWNGGPEPSPWSAAAFWEMGLLKKSDWQAQWIHSGVLHAHGTPLGCPRLRKGFMLDGAVREARIHVAALGHYELSINGSRVGADYLTPGWTDYSQRVQYQTYDVTTLVHHGSNAMGIQLAPGWFASRLGWSKEAGPCYGGAPALLLQLEVHLENGAVVVISSDESFKTAAGPLLEAEHYDGEAYDARLEQPGWDTVDYADTGWQPCLAGLNHLPDRGSPGGAPDLEWKKADDGAAAASQLLVHASPGPRVRRLETLQPISRTQPLPGAYVFDLGQNMVGWVRLRIPEGTAAGTVFSVRHAEVLNPDGTLYTANLRHAKCTDVYIAKGTPHEVFEPRFTFKGFRYAELSVTLPEGLTVPAFTPRDGMLEGVVIYSAMEPTGTFECSDPLVNQLQHNIVWGQKGNFIDVPTDCPQRDERLGWTGDAQVFCRTAAFNFDVAAFFTKWLVDLNDAQAPQGTYPSVAPDVLGKNQGDGGPGWADAGIIVPWTVYLCYGDRRVLERYYDAMKRYVNWLASADVEARTGHGDWLHHDAHTPLDLIATAFAAQSINLMTRIAAVLGRKKDTARFAAFFRRCKKAFNTRYVTPAGRVLGDTQTAYVLALAFDLLPEKLRQQAVDRLVLDIEKGRYSNTWRHRNWHLSTGFLGVKDINPVLTAAQRDDVAYRLLFTEDYPSWLFPVKNGATTIWERWDGWTPDKGWQDPGMNSFNHYTYGAIGQWLYQCVAGIDMDTGVPAYQRARIAPHLPPQGSAAAQRLTWVKAQLQTPYGQLMTHWVAQGGTVTLEVAIPANTTALIILPCSSVDAVRESGSPLSIAAGISQVQVVGQAVHCQAGSGMYQFTFPR